MVFEGRKVLADHTLEIECGPHAIVRRPFDFQLDEAIPAGRHVFAFRLADTDGTDIFFAVDVER